MTATQQADLLAAFADGALTVPVQYGASSATGVFDETDESLTTANGEDAVGAVITCVIITGAVPGLRHFTRITVNAVEYTIQDSRRIEDGAMTRLYLAAVVRSGEG